MTKRLVPVAQAGPAGPGTAALAGSGFVSFSQVVALPHGAVMSLQDVSPRIRARLASPRAPLCGLVLDRPRIMGILNATPDSFSDGGDVSSVASVLARAALMGGADILDIGGESTRPGAETISVAEEIRRVVPAIRALRDAGVTKPISIDTRKAAVARAALEAGADMVNDVTAFRYDPEMADVVAQWGVPACLMHSKGEPATMQINPSYDDVMAEVLAHLEERVAFALSRGVARDALVIDPGIGFGKSQAHNLSLLRGLAALHDLGLPVLLGASRKKFIGVIGGADVAADRVPGSLAVALHGASMGAQILRVHDVAETAQALALWRAVN